MSKLITSNNNDIKQLPELVLIESEWQDNTWANPFWGSTMRGSGEPARPVEVMLKNGATRYLSCPKCARGMFSHVVKWRYVNKTCN